LVVDPLKKVKRNNEKTTNRKISRISGY